MGLDMTVKYEVLLILPLHVNVWNQSDIQLLYSGKKKCLLDVYAFQVSIDERNSSHLLIQKISYFLITRT